MSHQYSHLTYCDWCEQMIDPDDDPCHFDNDGWCQDNWNKQAHYGDAVNKHKKEVPPTNYKRDNKK